MQIGLTIKVFTSSGLRILAPGMRQNVVRGPRRQGATAQKARSRKSAAQHASRAGAQTPS
ncbi:MAG TPA: hypothetical protein VK961_00715 [Chthoniobacter sp.]|nr:hypothetical protein [Chthoniobacter sp.]